MYIISVFVSLGQLKELFAEPGGGFQLHPSVRDMLGAAWSRAPSRA